MRRRLISIAHALFAQPMDSQTMDAMSMTLHDVIRLVQEERRVASMHAAIEDHVNCDVSNDCWMCPLSVAKNHVLEREKLYIPEPIER